MSRYAAGAVGRAGGGSQDICGQLLGRIAQHGLVVGRGEIENAVILGRVRPNGPHGPCSPGKGAPDGLLRLDAAMRATAEPSPELRSPPLVSQEWMSTEVAEGSHGVALELGRDGHEGPSTAQPQPAATGR